ncbi:MAG: TonB-dependent siderophore receptor [Amaricoccus sp.]|uniref:TonB-dependent siderophore receptor n=1 Tax=Amaricoccus sp. TaxID=1872485 RepID=UPI0039E448E3
MAAFTARPRRRRLSQFLAGAAVGCAGLAGPALGQSEATDDPALVLDTITVEGQGTATEGTGLYTSNAPTQTATGLALTPRQTPQSVSIVTQQRMLDRGDVILKDTINQTPGLVAATAYGDARWDFYARGGRVVNLQYDGLTLPVAWWGQEAAPADMVVIDHIEVVRGAAGLTEGPGEPSASVNLVRKRPLVDPATSVSLTGWDHGQASATLDVSRPLNTDGTVRGRAIAYGLTGDDVVDAKSQRTGLGYVALDADLTERTTLGLGFSYTDDRIDGYAWGGFWTRPDGSFYDFTATDNPSTDWAFLTRKQRVAYVDLTHRTESDWTLRLAGRLAHSDRVRFAGITYWTAPETLGHSGYYADGYEDSMAVGATATGEVQLFGRTHQLAFGADWAQVDTGMDGDTFYAFTIADPTRPFTWDLAEPARDGIVGWATDDRTIQSGIFASGRFEITPAVHVIAGARLAWYSFSDTYGDPATGWTGSTEFSVAAEPIPYIGVTYDVADTVTLYASYAQTFRPQSETDADLHQLAPATGSNLELGVKAALLDGGLDVSLALFDSELDGLPEALPQDQCLRPDIGCYKPAERISTRGAEIVLDGAITPAWNLSASYTYAYSAYAAGPNEGLRYNADLVPRHLGKIGTTYALSGPLAGLTVGGAIRAQSDTWSAGTNVDTGEAMRAHSGGYAVVDAMARYAFSDATALQVNVDNVFDRLYLSSVDASWGGNFYGDPRTVSLTLRHTF